MAKNQSLTAIMSVSPIDGRYRSKVEILSEYFSEYALIKYRVRVEIEYFIALCNIPLPGLKDFKKSNFEKIRDIYRNLTPEDALKVKEIEKVTNHDVKAVEYYIKDKFKEAKLTKWGEFIHFGLTSQDINNTAIPLSYKEGIIDVYLPMLLSVKKQMERQVKEWKNIPMLAHTHGQPASPTRLGKEIDVFVKRIDQQLQLLKDIPYSAKFGGATGGFNAHYVAYPKIDWNKFAKNFIEKKLKLSRSYPTTQIEHYDNLAANFDTLKRINTILIDFSRDIWTYISLDYFKQKIKKGEVGSSAMPHKVNPIDFENAEGNLGIANAIFEHLSAKLPISRLQRDLTDSTVLRNIGVPLAHCMIALASLEKGIDKLILNEEAVAADLTNNQAVVAEGIQTILRREGYPKPYEALKELTRKNKKITREDIVEFVSNLKVSESVRKELLNIKPENYTGK